jgi:hypothetical protein
MNILLLGAGHARMDAELARFIVGSGHHRTAVRSTANDQGLAEQLRTVAQFDGGVKHVHIDVNDLAQRLVRAHETKVAQALQRVNVKIRDL